jgi:hypothetical protein
VSDIWIDRLSLIERLDDSWYLFVDRATPRQLELVGFPPRGHRYWTSRTWSDVCQRYPTADLSAFRPQEGASDHRRWRGLRGRTRTHP